MSSDEPESPTTMGGVIRAIARVEPAPMLAPGEVFDQTYELMERLGGGGMGVVFRARDHRLGRDVAIKVLRPSPGDDVRLRKLFEREARATAQLLHPNIVTLHHVGEHAGAPYLVLELLTGETLATRLARRGKLPVPEAMKLLEAVLAALEFAHVRGVVHRDLKPSNVFITGDERIKVLDLGVSLALGVEAGPATLQAGTPGYMAPEQRTGGDQDARTDVWCAALLLVECLLGRLPPETPKPRELVARLVDSPPALRAVLDRALATDPAQRPASAGELQRAIANAVDGTAAPVRDPVPSATSTATSTSSATATSTATSTSTTSPSTSTTSPATSTSSPPAGPHVVVWFVVVAVSSAALGAAVTYLVMR